MESTNANKVKQMLDENLYLTAAFSNADGTPWVANLYFAYDQEMNFYWYSSENTRHSQYLEQNDKIAISIFDSHAVGDEVDAVYIEAQAYEIIDEDELIQGLEVYAQKMIMTNFVPDEEAAREFIQQKADFVGDTELRMYKAISKKVYKLAPSEVVNDKYVDSRIEIPLTDLLV